MTDDEIASLKLDGIYIIRNRKGDYHELNLRQVHGITFLTTNRRDCNNGQCGLSSTMLDELRLAIIAIQAGFHTVCTEVEYARSIELAERQATPTQSTTDLLSSLGLIKPPTPIKRRM